MLCVVRIQCISMEQAVWLLCVLFLQVCLLSTTALPGQERRTAAFQTNQAMGGSSPFLPGPPPQVDMKPLVVQLTSKRHEEGVRNRVGACSGQRPGSCSVLSVLKNGPPPPPESSRTKRHVTTKGRRKRPYRPGVLAAFSELAVPPYRSSA